MHFRILGLEAAAFDDLFDLSGSALAQRGAVRRVADAEPGYPCRVSLTDAPVGAEVILVQHLHQPAPGPYRSSHAIYVRRGERRFDAIDTVPAMLRMRLLSVRGFDDAGMMTIADVVDGGDLEAMIQRGFENPHTAYLHVHFARQGCYAARVERA